eukprot:NODE_849_length_3700_cov_0.478369.p1 type:complete len:250 gc:universal NODE_849_length_3700_cov_0.478369:2011-1262(-)
MSYFKQVDIECYVFFGVAIYANIQGLTISYILLAKDFVRNRWIVTANICYFISNILCFYQSRFNCNTIAYTVKVIQLFGTILEVLTPLSRAYKLMSNNVKNVSRVFSFGLLIFTCLQLYQLNYNCNVQDKQIVTFKADFASEFISEFFAVILYFISFLTILKVVYASDFLKSNSKLQVIKLVSIYAMMFAIVSKIVILVLAIIDTKDELRTALRCHVVLLLMVSQFAVEINKKATSNLKSVVRAASDKA